MAQELVLNEEVMKKLGTRLWSQWEIHREDRKAAEQRWLRNLRQFRGIYDPEIEKMIPKDRSKAYPKVTRWKVIGTVARLMQMLFPQTEQNWGLAPSPMPNLSKEQLQRVLDDLVAKKAQEQGVEPTQVECKDEDIEQAIVEYAKGKAEWMETKIHDDLQEMEYVTLARRVVFSAVLYNVGVLEGPMHQKYMTRTWYKDPGTGRYIAQEREKLKPLMEFRPVWDWYPDMTAKTLDKQDGTFVRHVMVRRDVEALGKRPDFIQENIDKWLRDHTTGNWKPEDWESELKAEKKSDRTNTNDGAGRKYVVLAYWGDITGHELAGAGAKVAEEDLGKTFHGNVWLLDNVVIKARVALLGFDGRHHHEFVFEEDDLSLLGNGQCDTLRDSQISICEATRMLLDEASLGGENIEINKDLLSPEMDYNMRSYKAWIREGSGAVAQHQAVRPIQRTSRLGELQAIVQMFMEIADRESGLPPPSLGDVSGGGSEALRTQQNASMFLGAAALPIRDTVRNFDTFTTSVITSLVKWNMKYDPNQIRDGDFDVIARGSTSLIAKEVLAQSLDVFATTLSDEERAHVKVRALLEARAKARDIPIAQLLEKVEDAEKAIAAMRAQQQKVGELQAEEIESKVRKNLADAFKSVIEGRAAEASITVEVFQTIMEGLLNGGGGKAGPVRAGSTDTSATA